MTKTKEAVSKDENIFFKFEGSTKYIFSFYMILCVLFLKSIFDIEPFYDNNNFVKTDLREYLIIVVGFAYSYLLFVLVKYMFDGFIEKNMVEKNKYGESKEEHKYRITKIIYSIIYYVISSSINFYLISKFQPNHLPKFFGGSLEVNQFLDTWPGNIDCYVRYFFILSIGHHVERTCEQIFSKKKYLNFWTMLLHHVLTVNLMLICFAHRQFLFGIPILLIHDITDIFLSILKIVREIKCLKIMIFPSYFLCLVVWFITRNYIFNFEIIIPLWFTAVPKLLPNIEANMVHLFASLGLAILMVLNTYWLFALLHAGVKKIFYNVEASVHEGENSKNK
jgi:hypothetical protein